MQLRVKRVYDDASPSDGVRILVDRLWPRGLSKLDAKIDLWAKRVAPSTELRRWYNHDPGKWDEFKRRYYAELSGNADAVVQIADYLDRGPVTLLFGTREAHYNNAVALKEYLESWQKDGE